MGWSALSKNSTKVLQRHQMVMAQLYMKKSNKIENSSNRPSKTNLDYGCATTLWHAHRGQVHATCVRGWYGEAVPTVMNPTHRRNRWCQCAGLSLCQSSRRQQFKITAQSIAINEPATRMSASAKSRKHCTYCFSWFLFRLRLSLSFGLSFGLTWLRLFFLGLTLENKG